MIGVYPYWKINIFSGNLISIFFMFPNRKLICSRILRLRELHQYRQEDVAEKLNMSQNAYSEFESGKRKIDIERLYLIAELFDISLNFLLDELPPPPIKFNTLFLKIIPGIPLGRPDILPHISPESKNHVNDNW